MSTQRKNSSHQSPKRPVRYGNNDREKLLKAKEIQLREHELELLQFEAKMAEMYEQMASWRDQCQQSLKNGTEEKPELPPLPPTLKKLRKPSNPSSPSTPSSVEDKQEDDELMILIEESSKTTKEKAQLVNEKLKGLSSESLETFEEHSSSTLKKPKIVLNLIEPLTKPPEKGEKDIQPGASNPRLLDKNLQKITKKHKKSNSVVEREEKIENDTPVPVESDSASISDTESDMRDYLNSSLGVSRGSLFDDTDMNQSGMEILENIMKQNSVPNRQKQSLPASSSVNRVQGEATGSELTRTRSTHNFTTREKKPQPKSQPEQPNFPSDIVHISKKIQGLEELLQPFRTLKFKFAAFVELPQNEKAPSSTILNSFRLTKRLTRSAPSHDIAIVYIETKCLIILFDDVICICSEKKLEVKLPIVETWMDIEYPSNPHAKRYPFIIKTPEKSYTCYLDQESKINALQKVWEITLRARLEQEKKYVGDFRRLLAYEFKSGEIYEGEWKSGQYSGKGNQRFPSGEYYEGYFLHGKRNGFGTLILPDKQRYDGYWKAGQRHGKGTLYFPAQDVTSIKYVGFWKEDQQHGEGQLYMKNGNILKAVWKFGHPTYPAALYLEEEGIRYVGDLSDQLLREGFGVCVYPSEDRYYGHWVNGERQGKGYYVTSKGTEYHGTWANNQMEGSGTLCFGNDESYITGKFSGDMSTGGVKVDGEFKLSRYDSQTRLSTVQGYKWHGFFSMRLSNYEKLESTQVLNEMLFKSLAKGESGENGEVKQDLLNIFQSRQHPLGKLVFEFINIFKALYNRPEQHFMQLDTAVDDIRSFLNLLSDNFVSQFLKCQLSHEDCSQALHEALFPEIYEPLLTMYNITHEEKDKLADEKVKEILQLSLRQQMAACGIDEKYWDRIEEFIESDIKLKAIDLNPSAEKAPYQNAVNAIRSMAVQHTVTEKLHFVKMAATRVESLLKKLMGQFGADEFLPMFSLVMVQSEAPKLHSECCFIDDFMDDNLRFNVYGYLLAQMQIATGFIIGSDTRTAHSVQSPVKVKPSSSQVSMEQGPL